MTNPTEIRGDIDLESLVGRVRAGDPAAMERLYEMVRCRVVAFFQRCLGVQDAEDQAHDTFLVVVEAIRERRLRSAQALLAFVHAIARRRLAQEIECVVRARQREAPGDNDTVADWRRNPEQNAIASEEAGIAERALERLGTAHREVLCRFYLQGESAEQICAEMKLTGTQFRLLKWRAKSRFSELGRRMNQERSTSLRLGA